MNQCVLLFMLENKHFNRFYYTKAGSEMGFCIAKIISEQSEAGG